MEFYQNIDKGEFIAAEVSLSLPLTNFTYHIRLDWNVMNN